ncbi:MAG: hypothetical protein AB7N76_13660 [Planctomycetota bacterium]
MHVLPLRVPPLRERGLDVAELAEAFLAAAGRPDGFAPEALARLAAHDWPGNVRELRNVVVRAALLRPLGPILAADVVLDGPGGDDLSGLFQGSWSAAKEAFGKLYLRRVLARVSGNVSQAARETEVQRSTLQRMLKRMELDPESFR